MGIIFKLCEFLSLTCLV